MRFAPHEIADLRKSADDAIRSGDVTEGNKLHLLLDEHEAITDALNESEYDCLEDLLKKALESADLEAKLEEYKTTVDDAISTLGGVR